LLLSVRALLHPLVLLLSLIAVGGGACRKPSGPPARFGSGPLITIRATAEIAGLERQMHARVNRDRAKQGLPPLAFDPALADVARAHSEDMRRARFFAHDSPNTGSLEDRLDRAGYLARTARENIGEGTDIDATQQGLLDSPGHYANLMARDVTHVGVGIVKGGVLASSNLIVTQVFAAPIEPADPARSRELVEKKIAVARKAAGLAPLRRDPKLEDLAKRHVADLSDDVSQASTKRIGDKVREALPGSGYSGVLVAATAFLAADLYEPQGAVVGSRARAIGTASARATDERGRPTVKLLLLIGM
jgi:uncharacterized protein YkwD